MPRPQETFLVLDTETGGDFTSPIVYDFGYTIVNKKGDILSRFTAVVQETITDADLMMNAFYAKKIFFHYIPKIAEGELVLKSWEEIRDHMMADVDAFNVKTICAYNAKFDCRAIKATNERYNIAQWFSKPTKILCLWEASCELLLNNRNYKNLAREMGWVSPKGNIKTSAEMAYRFVSGQHDFIESHTAIEDADIEAEILVKILAKKKKLPYNFSGRTWQLVNKKEVA